MNNLKFNIVITGMLLTIVSCSASKKIENEAPILPTQEDIVVPAEEEGVSYEKGSRLKYIAGKIADTASYLMDRSKTRKAEKLATSESSVQSSETLKTYMASFDGKYSTVTQGELGGISFTLSELNGTSYKLNGVKKVFTIKGSSPFMVQNGIFELPINDATGKKLKFEVIEKKEFGKLRVKVSTILPDPKGAKYSGIYTLIFRQTGVYMVTLNPEKHILIAKKQL